MNSNIATVTPISAAASNESVSTYSQARAHTRERDLEDIAGYYRDAFGGAFPPVVRRDVEWILDSGIEPAVIMICIDEATLALRPSWRYAMAILRKLRAEGVKDADQYRRRQTEWAMRTGRLDLF